MRPRDRTEMVVLLLVWVLPLLGVALWLLVNGLPLLAAALVTIEVVVALMVVAADRPPTR